MGPLGTGIFFFYLKQSSNVLYDYNKKFTVYVIYTKQTLLGTVANQWFLSKILIITSTNIADHDNIN
jgi:hypothetical protein